MKVKGRKVKLEDFLPEYAKPDSQDLLMAEVARELAKQKKDNG